MNGKTLFAFVAGAVVGAVGSWYYLNKKYYAPVDEPEDEDEEDSKPASKPETEPKQTDMEAETDEAARIEYNKVAGQYKEEAEKKAPYVISRDEFNDGTMRTHCTYSYFEDGIFTDEYNQVVDDIEEALGMTIAEVAAYFETDEDDLMYIRNEARYCDYEILREGITYEDPDEEE